VRAFEDSDSFLAKEVSVLLPALLITGYPEYLYRTAELITVPVPVALTLCRASKQYENQAIVSLSLSLSL
jgi:hypothetical protein